MATAAIRIITVTLTQTEHATIITYQIKIITTSNPVRI